MVDLGVCVMSPFHRHVFGPFGKMCQVRCLYCEEPPPAWWIKRREVTLEEVKEEMHATA